LPGGDAGRRLAAENEPMGTLVGKVLCDAVRFLAIQLLDDPAVLVEIGDSRLLTSVESNAGIFLNQSRQISCQPVELRHLAVVRALELHASLQRLSVVVIDRQPDVIGECEKILTYGFEIFEDSSCSISGERVLGCHDLLREAWGQWWVGLGLDLIPRQFC